MDINSSAEYYQVWRNIITGMVPQGSFGPFHPTEVVLDLKSEFFDIFSSDMFLENRLEMNLSFRSELI